MQRLRKKKGEDAAASDAKNAVPAASTTSPAASAPSTYIKVLKEYSLLMEYKRLKQQSPTGVYILPAADSLRRWYGVIFLRKGHYRGAVFKFVILIPMKYPDEAPTVHFLSEVFHPLIHPATGLLDLSPQFPRWNSTQHYIVLVLCYIKKIFYKTELWEARPGKEAMNAQAQKLWMNSKDEYFRQADACCLRSQSVEQLYTTPNDQRFSIHFERIKPAHEEAYRRIVRQDKEKGVAGSSYLDWFSDGVWKLDNTLDPVQDIVNPHASRYSHSHSHSASSSSSSATGAALTARDFPPISMQPISPPPQAQHSTEPESATEDGTNQVSSS